MLKKIELVNDVKLNNGVYCFVAFDENDKNNKHFVTSNKEFVSVDKEQNDSFFENGYNESSLYNILEKELYQNEYLENENVNNDFDEFDEFDAPSLAFNAAYLTNGRFTTAILADFYGEIYKVASFGSPDYASYLQLFDFSNFKLDFNKTLYLFPNLEEVVLKDVTFDEEKDEYSVSYFLNDEKDKYIVVDVDSQGFSLFNENLIFTNFSKNDLRNIFKEQEGYIYIGEKSGVSFVSNELVDNLNNGNISLDDVDFNVVKGEKYRILNVLIIYFKDQLIDLLVLNENEMDNQDNNVYEFNHRDYFENTDFWEEDIEIELDDSNVEINDLDNDKKGE